MSHSIDSLPKWAQEMRRAHLDLIHKLQQELAETKAAHAVLNGRNWFTLHGPKLTSDPDYYHLWLLDTDRPMTVCSLGRGDTLLIGRAEPEPVQPQPVPPTPARWADPHSEDYCACGHMRYEHDDNENLCQAGLSRGSCGCIRFRFVSEVRPAPGKLPNF